MCARNQHEQSGEKATPPSFPPAGVYGALTKVAAGAAATLLRVAGGDWGASPDDAVIVAADDEAARVFKVGVRTIALLEV
jgi:hypothetical protein